MTKPKSNLERFLSLFSEVRSGEGITAILLTLNVFLILTSYLIAKVVREPLILAGGGAELKSYTATAQGLLLMFALPYYSALVAKFPRKKLINNVTGFFVGCFFLFYLLAQFEIPFLGVAFFIWVGIFSLLIIAQFWGFANDIYSSEEGKRIFVIVAFGASAGGVFGPKIADLFIDVLGVYELLLVSGGILFVSLLLTNYVDKRENTRRAFESKKEVKKEENIDKGDAFRLIMKNKYLLFIALFVLLTNWVNTNGEYILGRVVSETAIEISAEDAAVEKNYIGKFYADFYFIVGLVGMLLQLFFVSRIIKFLGIRIAILILPVIALGGYFLMALFPVLSVIRWPKTLENSTDYSLNNTVRHMLFLPTTREEKYKGKVAIDSFFWRAGDVLSSVTVFVGAALLALGIGSFAIVNIILCVGWILLGVAVGKRNTQLVAEKAKGEILTEATT